MVSELIRKIERSQKVIYRLSRDEFDNLNKSINASGWLKETDKDQLLDPLLRTIPGIIGVVNRTIVVYQPRESEGSDG
ncbi:MAG: hypothetical protein GY861_19165 [bacterium]|nr:hypothetical protein [bacterium]